MDWAAASDRLVAAAGSDAEWYGLVARELVRPGDRVAVDVGCGGAGMAAALVEVDLGEGVAPLRAVLAATADIVWASGSVHHLGDQQAGTDALAGLLSEGGRLVLAEGGFGRSHLPWDLGVGDPGLERRLDAAQDRWFARMRAALPRSTRMPYGWTGALRRAGLTGVGTRSTLLERPTPLAAADRDFAVDGLAHRVDRLRPTGLLDAADLAAWDRLLDPADPAWLGHRDDLGWLEVRSVHFGTRTGP
jgi:SAM-dependent methyltransferase